MRTAKGLNTRHRYAARHQNSVSGKDYRSNEHGVTLSLEGANVMVSGLNVQALQ